MAEVRLAPGGSVYYGFRSDFGPSIEVPQASWLCSLLAGTDAELKARLGSCGGLLRRARTPDGALVAFVEHPTESWPIGLVREGVLVASAKAAPLLGGRLVATRAGPLLLALRRWQRGDGAWTGGELVPFALRATQIVRLSPIPLDEVDARDGGRVTARIVTVDYTTADVRVAGKRQEIDRADGHVLNESVVEELYDLAALAEER
ncbi:MAG: hypothetical protein HY901_21865 [Deltaproteobacteria bacterium]|nr:hypothetical protein [Deltaproteobacteria bacterium]